MRTFYTIATLNTIEESVVASLLGSNTFHYTGTRTKLRKILEEGGYVQAAGTEQEVLFELWIGKDRQLNPVAFEVESERNGRINALLHAYGDMREFDPLAVLGIDSATAIKSWGRAPEDLHTFVAHVKMRSDRVLAGLGQQLARVVRSTAPGGLESWATVHQGMLITIMETQGSYAEETRVTFTHSEKVALL